MSYLHVVSRLVKTTKKKKKKHHKTKQKQQTKAEMKVAVPDKKTKKEKSRTSKRIL